MIKPKVITLSFVEEGILCKQWYLKVQSNKQKKSCSQLEVFAYIRLLLKKNKKNWNVDL